MPITRTFGHRIRSVKLVMFAFHCLLLAAFVFGAGAVKVCPVQPTTSHPVRLHGDKCYQFHLRETRTFSAAQAECRSQGGNEVIIKDADTQRFLYDVLQRDMQYKGLVWLGLNDVSREGHFTWVDGTPVNFTFWGQGQPSQLLGSVEDCVAMDMADGGHWHDYVCEDFLFIRDPHPFMCEFRTTETTAAAMAAAETTTATADRMTNVLAGSTMEN